MSSVAVSALVGVLICVLGVMNIKGNISSIHWYHRHKVAPEDIKSFGKKVGLGTLIIGIAVIVFGLFSMITYLTDMTAFTVIGAVILVMSVVGGLVLSIYAMIKYNKGVF